MWHELNHTGVNVCGWHWLCTGEGETYCGAVINYHVTQSSQLNKDGIGTLKILTVQ
jgi:hypothetical protein